MDFSLATFGFRVKNGTMTSNVSDFDIGVAGQGKVKAFSGSGITANFETKKEQVEAEILQMKLDAMKRGFRTGTIRNAPPVIEPRIQ